MLKEGEITEIAEKLEEAGSDRPSPKAGADFP